MSKERSQKNNENGKKRRLTSWVHLSCIYEFFFLTSIEFHALYACEFNAVTNFTF